MDVEPEELARVLAVLEKARADLLDLRSRPWAEVTANPHLFNSLERSLEVAASCMVDVSAHVAARRGLPPAETYREVFQRLVAAGSLSETLGRRLEGWASLRNVLAHRYGAIDASRLAGVLQSELGDLDEFLRWVATLV